MNIKTIDFRNCKTIIELHYVIQQQLELPAWYGYNADALWDLLTGHIELPLTICLFLPEKPTNSLRDEIDKVIQVFKDAVDEGYEVKVLDRYEKPLF